MSKKAQAWEKKQAYKAADGKIGHQNTYAGMPKFPTPKKPGAKKTPQVHGGAPKTPKDHVSFEIDADYYSFAKQMKEISSYAHGMGKTVLGVTMALNDMAEAVSSKNPAKWALSDPYKLEQCEVKFLGSSVAPLTVVPGTKPLPPGKIYTTQQGDATLMISVQGHEKDFNYHTLTWHVGVKFFLMIGAYAEQFAFVAKVTKEALQEAMGPMEVVNPELMSAEVLDHNLILVFHLGGGLKYPVEIELPDGAVSGISHSAMQPDKPMSLGTSSKKLSSFYGAGGAVHMGYVAEPIASILGPAAVVNEIVMAPLSELPMSRAERKQIDPYERFLEDDE